MGKAECGIEVTADQYGEAVKLIRNSKLDSYFQGSKVVGTEDLYPRIRLLIRPENLAEFAAMKILGPLGGQWNDGENDEQRRRVGCGCH